MRRFNLHLVPVFLALLPGAAQADEAVLCPQFVFQGKEIPGLSDSEKRLICGDPQAKDWQKVPESQAMFHLRSFLQDRGFYYPQIVRKEKSVTYVQIGPPTVVSGIHFKGMPDDVAGIATWDFVGDRLTPALLKNIGQEVTSQLGTVGYACAEVETEADPSTGIIHVKVESGGKRTLLSVRAEPVEGVQEGTLRRYDGFVIGGPYRSPLFPLTINRVLADGVVRNTYFNTHCVPDGVIVEQKVLAGKPRQVALSIGLNTDRGLTARAAWKHSRLGARASLLSVELTSTWKGGEFNTQEGRLEAALYILKEPSRFFLRPAFNFSHKSDNRFDTVGGTLQVSPTMTWDALDVGGSISFGPAINAEYTIRGEGQRESYFLSLLGENRITSHDFELYRSSPRAGFESQSTANFSQAGLLANISTGLLRTRYTHLFPWPRVGRRYGVFGFRGELATTLVRGDEGGLQKLTASLRHYLGGTGNLRGFSIKELPDATGSLSSFFASFEARAVGILPFGLEPLAFIDMGTLSIHSFDISGPWFYSPGFGMRWQSPVGNFRASLAHGYGFHRPAVDPLSHWQFHLTFGEEF